MTGLLVSLLLLKNVHVIDPVKETVDEQSLILRDGRITEIVDKPPATFKGEVKDLSGKYLVPGFVDSHTHSTWGNPGFGTTQKLTAEDTSRLMLYCGVTAFADLFAEEDLIFPARDKSRKKNWTGATIYAAGPMLTSSDGHGTEFGIKTRTMDNAAGAKKTIAALQKQRKPDIFKIAFDHARDYKSMDAATMKATIAEANRLHVPTVVHIGTWADAEAAVDAGATAITHLHETDIPEALVKKMKAKGTVEIPTMVYQTEIAHVLDNAKWLDSPLLGAVTTPELLASIKSAGMYLGNAQILEIVNRQRKGIPSYNVSLKRLADGGVPLLTGTDGGDLAVFQGFSVHREMQILAEAGVGNWTTLRAGTSAGRKFLKRSAGIAVGDLADMVVLQASPLSDIANTQKIEMVWHDGKLVDRPALLNERAVSSGK